MGFVFSNSVTYATMKAIYGDKTKLGYYNSALIQAADILLPQILDGPQPTITPIGADQAPHARLTRDIARKDRFQERYRFKLPSFTFHYLIEGIDGSEKMSKKNPMSVFSLIENFKSEITPKIKNALTGGRDTAAEQRKLGGRPDRCRVFDLFKFMFEPDDKALKERETVCKNGLLLCGPCKNDLLTAIQEYQEKHVNKKDIMLPVAKELVEQS
jgi:tryptophanyl-tRNA synthetase